MKCWITCRVLCATLGASLGLLAASGAAAQRTTSPTVLQTATLGSSTYSLLSESAWDVAEAKAVTMGGHLVTIESLAENDFLLATFAPSVLQLATTGVVSLWLGLNDATVEGVYQWSSGSTSTFRNWYPGQPQNGQVDEDYAGMLVSGFGTPGTWHDIVADLRFNDRTFGIVEVSPVPEPATAVLWAIGLAGMLGCAAKLRKDGQRMMLLSRPAPGSI